MSKREIYVGTRVSEKEKKEIIELTKGMDITVSDLIRHRIIQPIMSIPEAIQNLKLYFDSKFKIFEHKITEIVKNQAFYREPIRRTYKEEYKTIEQTILPAEEKEIPQEYIEMRKVLSEMQKLVRNGEEILEATPIKELERKRAKTDPLAYKEWKAKNKK
nr:MAG: mobilisation protein MobC/VirD1 [uncultured archaeon]